MDKRTIVFEDRQYLEAIYLRKRSIQLERARERSGRAARRAASNRMACAVQAGEGGGAADDHHDRPEGFSKGFRIGRVSHENNSSSGGTRVQLDFKVQLYMRAAR